LKGALADRGFYAPISLWGFYGASDDDNDQAA
jgi:hypothetical protein